MEENPQIQKEYYVAFIGERSVGKTSIINRYKGEKYDENVQPTQGSAFASFNKEREWKNTLYTIHTKDIPIDEKTSTSSFLHLHFKGVKGCVIVYDISNKATFNNLESMFQIVSDVEI